MSKVGFLENEEKIEIANLLASGAATLRSAVGLSPNAKPGQAETRMAIEYVESIGRMFRDQCHKNKGGGKVLSKEAHEL